MDMMSNPGFVQDPGKAVEIQTAMSTFLQQNSILTCIMDYPDQSCLYPGASILPALPHALVSTKGMTDVTVYTGKYKNLKRKLKRFKKKGGTFEIIPAHLSEPDLSGLKKCFLATSRKSVFYLPYQDLYLNAALTTSKSLINNAVYFVARLDNEFLGYQAALKTGDHLNALHGAFDRHRKTTFHAYDILFVKMTEFAIENNLESIDFGSVINDTKKKMVNQTLDMSYFLLSKYNAVRHFFNYFLKKTKIQGSAQLKYL